MRILYDGKIYGLQTAGGINRYFENLICRLPKNFIPTITSPESPKFHYPSHPNLKTSFYPKLKLPPKLSLGLQKYYFRSINGINSFDVAHPTYYKLLTRLDLDKYKCPVVVTVHDMIYEIFSDTADPYGQKAEYKRKAILAADAIICVSENTKKDLLKQHPSLEDKITVTYLASDIDASLSYGSEPVPSRPYYLYVGSRNKYKNFDGLLQALAKTVSIQPDVVLCIVGSPLNKTEEELIAELKLTNHIEYYGYVSDSHLAKLYRCSVAFVYPSLYEGFGIPPLEAMSCGTAVVASNCSSIPEVVGDAGLLFEPNATSDLTDILLLLLNSSTERDRLIQKGYQRTRAFSWDKTAAQTINVYQSVSSSSN